MHVVTDDEPMTIGDLSERTGASPRSLRHYETQDLLSPSRTASGYRVYDRGAVEVVLRIRALLALGLPLRLVREVLPCVRGHDLEIVRACPELHRVLTAEADRLAAAEAELRATREAIGDVLRSADFGSCDEESAPAAG